MVLKLNSFGLFRNQSFELGQITIFFGKNESGKTTIFDAIVSSLIRITGTTSYGKKN
jgi:DNA sulfur modification protein DndD